MFKPVVGFTLLMACVVIFVTWLFTPSTPYTDKYPTTMVVQYNFDGQPINCFVVYGQYVIHEQEHILIMSGNNILERVSGPVSTIRLNEMPWNKAAKRLRVNLEMCN